MDAPVGFIPDWSFLRERGECRLEDAVLYLYNVPVAQRLVFKRENVLQYRQYQKRRMIAVGQAGRELPCIPGHPHEDGTAAGRYVTLRDFLAFAKAYEWPEASKMSEKLGVDFDGIIPVTRAGVRTQGLAEAVDEPPKASKSSPKVPRADAIENLLVMIGAMSELIRQHTKMAFPISLQTSGGKINVSGMATALHRIAEKSGNSIEPATFRKKLHQARALLDLGPEGFEFDRLDDC